MSEKIVKIRKPRVCLYCQKDIPVGSQAKFISTRGPRLEPFRDYNDDFHEKQVGIYYAKHYECVTHTTEDHAKVAGVTVEQWRQWEQNRIENEKYNGL